MPITYTVAIDANHDGDFIDMGEAISSAIIDITWRLGMAELYASLAPPATATITVRNPDKAFSPEYAGGLQPGTRIRIQSDDGTTVRTHFTGLIDHIAPSSGALGQRTAVIHAIGVDAALAAQTISLPPQTSVTADDVIDAVLDAANLRRAILAGYCIIGVSGYNSLDTAKLFGQNSARTLESGKSTFAYVGDTWDGGIRAASAIAQTAVSERGRFFCNRAGEAVFYNRHHTLTSTTSAAAFADDMDGLAYAYGADVTNHVQVTLTPRSIGAAHSTLWTLVSSQRIDPGITTLHVRFRDDDDQPTGALLLLPPIAGIDFNANTAADGTGTDQTDSVRVQVEREGFSSATLRIISAAGRAVYLQAGMRLRGTPLLIGDPVTIEHVDMESVTFYGQHSLTLNLPTLTSLDEADQMARYELARRKSPRGTIRAITLSTRTHPAHVLARTLFDRITITETQTHHSGDYIIVAEDHHVTKGGTSHTVVWSLEPADSDVYVVIGLHNPDGTRVLAY